MGRELQNELPAMQNAIQETEARMRTEYHNRVVELEKERAAIVEDKAQVERYKELLLQQRDVMIQLTASLNKRDETLMSLQEELDAFDHHQREMEDILDHKTNQVLHLQKFLLECEHGGAVGQPAPQHGGAAEGTAPREGRTPMALSAGPEMRAEAMLGSAEESRLPVPKVEEQKQKLHKIREEKNSLEFLLKERLEQMVHTEIEERIAKICQQQPANANTANVGMLELASMRSDTPEFQQRLASIVQSEALRKHGGPAHDAAEQQRQTLVEALSQKGAVMQEVCNEVKDTQSHQRLLRKMMEQENGTPRHPLRVSNRMEADGALANMRKAHEAKLKNLQSEIHTKDNAIRTALQKNRRLMGASIDGAATGPTHMQDIQHNIKLIEKETEMVSKSYQEKVKALRHEKVLEEERLRQERTAQDEELRKYIRQCENDSKERQAIKTILEVKIMGLVDNIAKSSSSMDCSSTRHDVVSLRKLVSASVEALE